MSGYQIMCCRVAQWMTSLQERTPHSIHPKEKKKPSQCWKEQASLSVLHASIREEVFTTYPSNLLKMRGIFFEVGQCPIEIPCEADVQYRIVLNLARQDDAFSNSDIHVWRCQSDPCWFWEQKNQLLDFCSTTTCLPLMFYHVLQAWLMTVTSNYTAGL